MARRRGAQPGNRNAVKHGLYGNLAPGRGQAQFQAADLSEQDACLRTLIRATMDKMSAVGDLDLDQYLSALRTVSFAVAILHRLQHLPSLPAANDALPPPV